jgi:SAM-dependent methyltransferase
VPTLSSTVNLLGLFADPTRVRLVALLAGEELTVNEITSVTELPQSRVSTHLGRLREARVLRDRKVGASTFYSVNDGAMPADARALWDVLHKELGDTVLDADRGRKDALVRARRRDAGSLEAFAGEMERHYSPGRTWEALAHGLLGLLRLGDVLDLGCGDGSVAQLLAPRARSVTCLDSSERMVGAARARLKKQPNVEVCAGDAHDLPFADGRFDQALLFNVLAYAERPARVLAEAARVLRPGGSLVVVTLDAHSHEEVAAAYRHAHPGFRTAEIRKLLRKAGLDVARCEVTSRERRTPHFQIVTAIADKPTGAAAPVPAKPA